MTEQAKEAQRKYMREYRRTNKDRLNAYRRAWNAENPDKVKKYRENYWNNRGSETEC